MHKSPLKAGNIRSSRYIPLRFRFIIIISILLILLLGSIAWLVGLQLSRNIQSQVEKRGLSIAESLSATSKAALLTYNYIALEQSANQAAMGPDIVYVIVHDKEGRVAGYSGKADLQGKHLDDAVSEKATSNMQPTVQHLPQVSEREQALEVAVPVFLPGSDMRWGTIRVALSLKPMFEQILQTRLVIAGAGLLALLLGILVSVWAARRITRPLGHLMNASVEAAQGNLNQEIEVRTGDEVEVLASNFSAMMREILGQRRQLEKQLTEIGHLQRYTEKLLVTMNDGLLSVDTDGRLAAINPAASRMLRVPEGIEKGSSALAILEGVPALREYIEDVVCNPGSRNAQEQIYIERGEDTQIVHASSSFLTDASGATLEVITNLHDITELKKLEARIRQAERLAALGTLAAGMAHEIRNPLSAIKTFVQLLPRKIGKEGFLEKFQRTVPRELERINRLIEDLLELSRNPKYHFDVLDVKPLIEQTLELFEEDFVLGQIRRQTRFPPAVPLVRADADQLVKAFHNLVRNAIQAMPGGGELSIEASWLKGDSFEGPSTSNQHGWMAVSFTDTGYGITPENLKTIFNPFFTTKDAGTGLGLAITHKVISEHGGHIDVKSRIGEGTCFTIHIPVAADHIHREDA